VLRDGKIVDVPSSDVVPGDLLFVGEGDVVTADARQGAKYTEKWLVNKS